MLRFRRGVLLAVGLVLLVASTCFAHLVDHKILSGTNWYSSTDTVQDSYAYYKATVSEDIKTVSANKLHWTQTRATSTITRGDPVWGYYYVFDAVYGTSRRFSSLYGKHMLDYSLIQFEVNWDTLVDTNKYPYSETYTYSRFPYGYAYKLTSRYVP